MEDENEFAHGGCISCGVWFDIERTAGVLRSDPATWTCPKCQANKAEFNSVAAIEEFNRLLALWHTNAITHLERDRMMELKRTLFPKESEYIDFKREEAKWDADWDKNAEYREEKENEDETDY